MSSSYDQHRIIVIIVTESRDRSQSDKINTLADILYGPQTSSYLLSRLYDGSTKMGLIEDKNLWSIYESAFLD